MSVAVAYADDYVRAQPQFFRPFVAECAGLYGAGIIDLRNAPQNRNQQRVNLAEEALGRIPAPVAVPELLGTGNTVSPLHGGETAAAGQQVGNKIAFIHKCISLAAHRLVGTQDVQDLCPGAFGRIVIPALTDVVRRIAGTCGGEFLGLGSAGVVLPEDEHRIGIVSERRVKREGHALRVGEAYRASRGVDRNGFDRLRLGAGGDHLAQNRLKTLDVVERMLAELLAERVAPAPFGPAGVGTDCRGGDRAVRSVHKHGAGRIGAVIDTYCVAFHLSMR